MVRLNFMRTSSPLGELMVGAGDAGLAVVGFGTGYVPSARGYELVEGATPLVEDAISAIEGYLAGAVRTFDLPLDLGLASPFAQQVLKVLIEVPYGDVTSYGALAKAAGTSARAVGGAVGSNPLPIVIPCHRVIAADGSLGGFSGGLDRKRRLLALEGHEPLSGGWAPRRRKVFA